MQFSVFQLKEKLLEALDNEYNVVDLQAVLAVVTSLEVHNVTRDTLEETRLGKWVNEMRRKTSNRDLAKRAKNLVRKWKQLVETPAGGPQSTVNGRSSTADGGASAAPVSNKSSSRPCTPHIPQATTQFSGTITSPSALSCTVTPKTLVKHSSSEEPMKAEIEQTGSKPCSPNLPCSGSAPGVTCPDLPSTPCSSRTASTPLPGHSNCRLDTPVMCDSPFNQVPPELSASDTPLSSAGLSKTNAANRKRRRPEGALEHCNGGKKLCMASVQSGPANGQFTSSHSVNSLPALPSTTLHRFPSNLNVDGVCVSPPDPAKSRQTPLRTASVDTLSTPDQKTALFSKRNCSNLNLKLDLDKSSDSKMSKTPKVKTTAQLIADMSASGDLHLGSSATVNRIANNQIEKEEDTLNQSVVPLEARPRPRKKPGTLLHGGPPPVSDRTLQQTKSEMVQKFLQTSISPSSSELDLNSPFRFDQSSPPSRTNSPLNATNNNIGLAGVQNSTNSNIDMMRISDHSEPAPVMFFIGDEDVKGDTELEVQRKHDTVDAAKQKLKEEQNVINRIIADPWSHLPPLKLDQIDLTTEEYTVTEHPPCTEEDVDKLHNTNWDGVNGQQDYDDTWHPLTDTYSMPTFSGDLLHILPYVDLDS